MRFLIVMILSVCVAFGDYKCITNKQIKNKEYAVFTTKLFEVIDVDLKKETTKRYPNAIYIKPFSGDLVELLRFEVDVKNLIVVHESDKENLDNHNLGAEFTDYIVNPEIIFQKKFIPKGSVIAIETSTPGSGIVGIVGFVLENGTEIRHWIRENTSGYSANVYYDKNGEKYYTCD